VAEGGGPLALLFLLLFAGARVDAQDFDDKTPLDMADVEEVKAVLRQHGGKHSLFGAAEKGMVQDVAELIKGGADVNETVHGEQSGQQAPLHYAAAHGHGSVVDQLLQARADVNLEDEYNEAPLHKAARNGHDSVVDQLLQARADVNVKCVDQQARCTRPQQRVMASWWTSSCRRGPTSMLKTRAV